MRDCCCLKQVAFGRCGLRGFEGDTCVSLAGLVSSKEQLGRESSWRRFAYVLAWLGWVYHVLEPQSARGARENVLVLWNVRLLLRHRYPIPTTRPRNHGPSSLALPCPASCTIRPWASSASLQPPLIQLRIVHAPGDSGAVVQLQCACLLSFFLSSHRCPRWMDAYT